MMGGDWYNGVNMMKKIIIIIIILLALAPLIAFYGPSGSGKAQTVKISSGSSVTAIGQDLKDKKIISSVWLFKAYLKATGNDDRMTAGYHDIVAHASLARVVKQLCSPASSIQERNVTIIEGWRLKDVAADLEKDGVVSEADFLSAAQINNWRSQYDFLSDKKITSLEGFLYPDTYRVYKDASSSDIIKKALDEFAQKVTPQMRADLKAQNRSLIDAVILASIIEREISNQPAHDAERAIVADIFWKRIKIGMGLQSDATVNYITGKTSTRPTLKDLAIDSPYNTYMYKGLPPGPINNPSLASIQSVIYPTKNDYYYFLTDANGKAYFAKTYDEHLANIKRYLDN